MAVKQSQTCQFAALDAKAYRSAQFAVFEVVCGSASVDVSVFEALKV